MRAMMKPSACASWGGLSWILKCFISTILLFRRIWFPLSSLWNALVSMVATQRQKMDPLSCLACGQVHSSQNYLHFVLQTNLCSLQPKGSILTKFFDQTHLKKTTKKQLLLFANFCYWILQSRSRKGFLLRKWRPENTFFGHEKQVIFIFSAI